jgi:hypothetical protein
MDTLAEHLVDQVDWHWAHQLRPRFDGLTDGEYFREPVPDCWSSGVRGLTAADLERAVGPAEGPFAERPMLDLVLHINREVIHHGAEIALLRDLYVHTTKEN